MSTPQLSAVSFAVCATVTSLPEPDRDRGATFRRFVTLGDLVLQLYPQVQEPGRDTEVLIDNLPSDGGGMAAVLGCGVGAETLVLLARGWDVTAVDLNPASADATWRNAVSNGLERGLITHSWSLKRLLKQNVLWDLVVANPPQMPTPPEAERADWIGLAHNGGPDGTAIIREICQLVPGRLSPSGTLLLLQLDFLPLSPTLDLLRRAGLVVKTRPPVMRPMGVLSFERRSNLREHTGETSYGIVIVEGRQE